MPIGFPVPTLGQQWPTLNPTRQWDGTKWFSINTAYSGAATPVVERVSVVTGTMDFIVIDNDAGGTPKLVSATALAESVGGVIEATSPAALLISHWTAEPTLVSGEVGINIITIPSDGGSPITGFEYRVGAGGVIALTGLSTGLRVVTSGFIAGIASDIQVRAVNAVGAGAWSDVKNRTPLAGGGDGTIAWRGFGSKFTQPTESTSHAVSVPAGTVVGDMLLIWILDQATPSSVATDTAQALPLLSVYSSANEIGRLYGVVIAGSVPTTINVTFGTASGLDAHAMSAQGVAQLGGVINDGNSGAAITQYPYTATVGESLVTAMISHNSALTLATAQFNGADAADNITRWDPTQYYSNFAGKHGGATGANVIDVTWSGGTSTGGRWHTVELVP